MTSHYPHWIRPIERDIIDGLISAILEDEDVLIKVHDGMEWATEATRDREVIEKEIAATDVTELVVPNRGGFLLIHGNDEDVLSDHTDNAYCEAICEKLVERGLL